MCRFYKSGSCVYGKMCRYKHEGAVMATPASDDEDKNKGKKRVPQKRTAAPAVVQLLSAMSAMSSLCVSGAAATKAVRFGGTEVSNFRIPRNAWMDPTPGLWHDLNYKGHKQWRREAQADQCEEEARQKAEALAKEVGMLEELPMAMASSFPRSGPSRWIVDTGSALHLVSKKDVKPWSMAMAHNSEYPVMLNTANGVIEGDREVPMQLLALGSEISPTLLDSTPAVLSVGKLCMEEGYDFIWRKYKTPYMTTPEGKKLTLQVDQNVPFLVEYVEACPAQAPPGSLTLIPHLGTDARASGSRVPVPIEEEREAVTVEDVPQESNMSQAKSKEGAIAMNIS